MANRPPEVTQANQERRALGRFDAGKPTIKDLAVVPMNKIQGIKTDEHKGQAYNILTHTVAENWKYAKEQLAHGHGAEEPKAQEKLKAAMEKLVAYRGWHHAKLLTDVQNDLGGKALLVGTND